MFVKMTVKNLALDPLFNAPIVILKNDTGDLIVPIWIGVFEANAIVTELDKVPAPRPLTHDLIRNILHSLDVTIPRVLITDLKDGVYYAVIELKLGGTIKTIDCRPSDAIAIALRFNAPIFVSQDVIEKSKAADHLQDQDDAEKLKSWLESLKPEDFGKYSM